MTEGPNPCPKCGGRMERGFTIDDQGGARAVSTWAAGEPKKSWWTGTRMPEGGAVPVATYRCTGCGLLESYARPEFAAE